jgi:hypothetical protein
VSAAEAGYLAKSIKPLIDSNGVVVLERAGEPIAAALIVPNLFDYIGDMNGRLAPLNWISLLWRARRKRFKSLRVVLFGVLPRVSGAMAIPAILLRELIRRALLYEFEFVKFGWILEDKTAICRSLVRQGAMLARRHRLYEMPLDSNVSAPGR